MWATEVQTDPSAPAWLVIVIAALTALGGGTGVAAIMKARTDAKQGVDAHELDEDNAISDRWKQLATAQLELLMAPLREEMAELRGKVARLEKEAEDSRTRYWRAIGYIRTLNGWIAHHVTDPALVPPPPPADLAEHI